MWGDQAISALRANKLLTLHYHGFARDVEVHAVGYSAEGVLMMRVWQVGGGSVSNERVGWKLMRLNDAVGASISEIDSLAPRPGYKRGDKALSSILAEL